jgi:hypothetical protein
MKNRKFGFNNHKSDNYTNSVEELLIDLDKNDHNEQIVDDIISISLPSKNRLIKFRTDIKEYSLFKEKQKVVITKLLLRLQKYAYDRARQDSDNELVYSYKVIKYGNIFFSKLLIAANKSKEENKINYILLLSKAKVLFHKLRILIINKGNHQYLYLDSNQCNIKVTLHRRKKKGIHIISKFKEYIRSNNNNNNVIKIGNKHYYHSYGLKTFYQWLTKLQDNFIIQLGIYNANKYYNFNNKNYAFKKLENNYIRNILLLKMIKKDIKYKYKNFILKLSANCKFRKTRKRNHRIAFQNDNFNSLNSYLLNWINILINNYKYYGLVSKGKKYYTKRSLEIVIKKLKILLIGKKNYTKQLILHVSKKSKPKLKPNETPSVKRHLFNRLLELTTNNNWWYTQYQHAKTCRRKYLIHNSISKWINFTTTSIVNLKINQSQNIYYCLFYKKNILQRWINMIKANNSTCKSIQEIDNRYRLVVYKSFLNKIRQNITSQTTVRKRLKLAKNKMIKRHFNKMANAKVNRIEVCNYHRGLVNVMLRYYKAVIINKLKSFKLKSCNIKNESLIKNEKLKIHLKQKYFNQFIKAWRNRKKYIRYQLKFNKKAYNLRISHVGNSIISKWQLFVRFRHQIHHNSKSKASAYMKIKICKFGFNRFINYAHNRKFDKSQYNVAVNKYNIYILKLSFNNIKMVSASTRKFLISAVNYDQNKIYRAAISKLYSNYYFNRHFTNDVVSYSNNNLQLWSINKLIKFCERKKDLRSSVIFLNNHYKLYSMYRFIQFLHIRVVRKQSIIISEQEEISIADGIKADEFHIYYNLHRSIQLLFENNLTARLIEGRISNVKLYLNNLYMRRSFERFNDLVITKRYNSHYYKIYYNRKTALALKKWLKLSKISKNNRRKSFINNNKEKNINLDKMVKQIEFNLNKGKKHRRRSSVSVISTVSDNWSNWLSPTFNSYWKSCPGNHFKSFEYLSYIDRCSTGYLTTGDFKPWKLRVLQTIAIEWYFSNQMIKFINMIKNTINNSKNLDLKVHKHDVHYTLCKSFKILRKLTIKGISYKNKSNNIYTSMNNLFLKRSLKILLVNKKDSIAYRIIKLNKKRKIIAAWSHLNNATRFSRNLIRQIWLKKELVQLKAAFIEWVTDTNFERMSENINKEIFINNKRKNFLIFSKKILSSYDRKKTVILYRGNKAMILMHGILQKIFTKISDRYKRLDNEEFYYNYHINRMFRIVILNLKFCRINRISSEHLIKKQRKNGFDNLINNKEIVEYNNNLINIGDLVFKKKLINRWINFIINNVIENQNYVKRNRKSGLSNITAPPGIIANDWRIDRMKYITLMTMKKILLLEPLRLQQLDEYVDNQYLQIIYKRSFKKIHNNYKYNKMERKSKQISDKLSMDRCLRTAILKFDMNICAKWSRDQNLRLFKKEKEKLMLRKGLRALEQLLIVTLY